MIYFPNLSSREYGVKEKVNDVDEAVDKENDYGYEYERFFSYFTQDELREYIKNLGLEFVWESVTHSGRRNWIQIIGRKNA